MNLSYLDFEQPIADLEGKIEELKLVESDNDLNIGEEINRLKEKSIKLTESIYSNLSPWQIVQVARHPQRPYASDYIARIFDDWDELHGDRHFGDDHAIIGGIGRLDGEPVMVIGEEKGRSVKEKVYRNFGMPKPEGYRKALRLMEMAERFKLPVLTLIDTPGAYPGIDSEERGISESIAQNLAVMSRLKTPIICTVIGKVPLVALWLSAWVTNSICCSMRPTSLLARKAAPTLSGRRLKKRLWQLRLWG